MADSTVARFKSLAKARLWYRVTPYVEAVFGSSDVPCLADVLGLKQEDLNLPRCWYSAFGKDPQVKVAKTHRGRQVHWIAFNPLVFEADIWVESPLEQHKLLNHKVADAPGVPPNRFDVSTQAEL